MGWAWLFRCARTLPFVWAPGRGAAALLGGSEQLADQLPHH
jgi:hypothetical protein